MSAARQSSETREVRAGEELDAESLRRYVAARLDHPIGPLTITQFPGGLSNLTYLVAWDESEYVLRRPPFGSKVKSAHDMGREYTVLSALAPAYEKVPKPLFHCDDSRVLGAPFYLMERIRGTILRRRIPNELDIDESKARRLCEVMVDTLVELHSLKYPALGLDGFGRPQGYIERQVSGWTKRYADSRTDDLPNVEAIATWLLDNMPEDGTAALIHNDFKLDNLVLEIEDPIRVRGILDWEMSTIGDPLMDLGTALCYWVNRTDPQPMQTIAFAPSTEPGMMTRGEIADRYAEQSGRELSNIVYYYCFGLFKTAVVVQQIYYRFKQGLTKDPRFATLIEGVKTLSAHAVSCSESGGLG